MSQFRAAGSALLRAAGENLKRIRVGGVPEHFNTPWHTAIAAGLFEEASLQIDWSTYPGGTGAMAQALREDEIDVAVILTEGIVADIHRGNPSKLIGTYVSSPLIWGVHVASGSKWREVSELQHATYAVSRLGSGSHLMAKIHAQKLGWDPETLKFAIVKDLQGARKALGNGTADVFLWEKYTTKELVDSREWRRIGEVPTPWSCFSLAATDKVLEEHSESLVTMLSILEKEAHDLRASANACETIAAMYGLQERDVAEWIKDVSWSCRPVVCHKMLEQVMQSLVSAGVLDTASLKRPHELVAELAKDVE
mmetsp:Transcript_28477/g.70805  ORF Transcript_28477/g.70805 Transcript_28477/m.70805 type:complete len:310 (+) Transcript_28477:57-986(+)